MRQILTIKVFKQNSYLLFWNYSIKGYLYVWAPKYVLIQTIDPPMVILCRHFVCVWSILTDLCIEVVIFAFVYNTFFSWELFIFVVIVVLIFISVFFLLKHFFHIYIIFVILFYMRYNINGKFTVAACFLMNWQMNRVCI